MIVVETVKPPPAPLPPVPYFFLTEGGIWRATHEDRGGGVLVPWEMPEPMIIEVCSWIVWVGPPMDGHFG